MGSQRWDHLVHRCPFIDYQLEWDVHGLTHVRYIVYGITHDRNT